MIYLLSSVFGIVIIWIFFEILFFLYELGIEIPNTTEFV